LWRRLQALGAVPIKNAVYALPASDQAQEDFEWLLKEIVQSVGEARICEARLIDGLSDQDVCSLFNAARDNDYAEIAEEARALSTKLEEAASADSRAELKVQFARLKRRYDQTVSIDFFDSTGRLTTESLMSALNRSLTQSEMETTVREETTELEELKNRVGVTRRGVHVDRMACSGL